MNGRETEFDLERENLIDLLNEDLAREYQAIISYAVYSHILNGTKYMSVAAELEVHAAEEVAHAGILAGLIDYFGGTPVTVARATERPAIAEDMLRFDLAKKYESIDRYSERVRQCESLGEHTAAEQIQVILMQERDHQIALAKALGKRSFGMSAEISHLIT